MNLADTIAASFNQVVNDLLLALPAIIGALIILLVGWIIAKIASGVIRRLVQRAGVDRTFAERGADVYGKRASALSPSRLAGTLTYWVILLIFVVAAANFLGWPQVSTLINNFIGW